jgi:hypothetical protein
MDSMDRLSTIGECRERIMSLLNDKHSDWKQTAQTYIESGDIQSAAMMDHWSFACSLISSWVLCEFIEFSEE